MILDPVLYKSRCILTTRVFIGVSILISSYTRYYRHDLIDNGVSLSFDYDVLMTLIINATRHDVSKFALMLIKSNMSSRHVISQTNVTIRADHS